MKRNLKSIISLSLLASLIIMSYSCNDSIASKVPDSSGSIVNNIRIYNPQIKPYLVKAIDAINSGNASYNWCQAGTCNVGVVGQCVTQLPTKDFIREYNTDYTDFTKYVDGQSHSAVTETNQYTWKNLISYYCGVTNRPMKGIVKDLLDAGFSKEDIVHLEFLSDPYILKHTKIDTGAGYYADKDNVLQYLKAWVGIIDRQHS